MNKRKIKRKYLPEGVSSFLFFAFKSAPLIASISRISIWNVRVEEAWKNKLYTLFNDILSIQIVFIWKWTWFRVHFSEKIFRFQTPLISWTEPKKKKIWRYIRDPSKQLHVPVSIDLCQQHRLLHDFLIGIQRLWNIHLRMLHVTVNKKND